MQALTETVTSMVQVGQDSISVADPAAVPKVWMGLTVLHERTPHVKVLQPMHQGRHGTWVDPLQASVAGGLTDTVSKTECLAVLWIHSIPNQTDGS